MRCLLVSVETMAVDDLREGTSAADEIPSMTTPWVPAPSAASEEEEDEEEEEDDDDDDDPTETIVSISPWTRLYKS